MTMRDATDLILSFNKQYPPDRQLAKYRAMQESTLRFYRGSCHLFYDRLDSMGMPKDKTKAWICGDLHLENFGSFKGDNRLVYFDVNDFDEALLAPLSMEVLRFITAILVSNQAIGYSKKEGASIAKAALKNYTAAIVHGKALIEQRETATGLMKVFFDQAQDRKRQDFIAKVTEGKGKKRMLHIDDVRTQKLNPELKEKLLSWIPDGFAHIEKLHDMKVEDCARRAAGTGSLGVERYVILSKHKGSGKYYLLDMKEARASALIDHVTVKQPKWKNNAERVIDVQSRMQFCAPALLSAVRFEKKNFVVKELQPVQDKMDFKLCAGSVTEMENVILSMADIAAYAHLRGTGRQGSSTADELSENVSKSKWQKEMYDLSHELAAQVAKDYGQFIKYRPA